MELMKNTLLTELPGLGLELPEERIDTLCAFGAAMVKQNEVMNLTAITESAAVARLHLMDSLTVMRCLDLKGKRLIDVGLLAASVPARYKVAPTTSKGLPFTIAFASA